MCIRDRSSEIIDMLNENKMELADRDKDTLATKTHINKLKTDLKSLEEELRRLKAGAKTDDDLGSGLRPFPGHGDRQYLTDLKMGGKRIFILVDVSASMLDETIVGIIRRRNLKNSQKLSAPKWRQVLKTVDWLITRLPPTSKFQIYTFNDTARPLIEKTKGVWLDAGELEKIIDSLSEELLTKDVPDYLRASLEEAKELVTGPESFLSEWKDLGTVLRMLQYRILGENPTLGRRLAEFQSRTQF